MKVLLTIFLKFLSLLPFRFQMFLGEIIGRFLFMVLKKRRSVAKCNLQKCFPHFSEKEIHKISKKNFMRLGQAIFEITNSYYQSDKKFKKKIKNISEFKSFLNQNQTSIDINLNISDYFGNAQLSEDESSYEGSIGLKYGIRLCYIPPEGYNPFDSLSFENQGNLKAQQHRSYILTPASFQTATGSEILPSSRYSFPLCSFEEDILDVKISELLNSDDNLNQDIKCYVDKLVETKNYKHLVDNVLQIKKVPSVYIGCSLFSFISSISSSNSSILSSRASIWSSLGS